MSSAIAWTGRMPCVCMLCGDKYGEKPCAPEMDGKASHGLCAGCEPIYQAQIDALFFAGAHRKNSVGAGRESDVGSTPKKQEGL